MGQDYIIKLVFWQNHIFIGHKILHTRCLAKCNVAKSSVTDTLHGGGASLRQIWWSVEWEVGSSPASTSGWKEARFYEYIMCPSGADKLTLMVGVTLPGRDLLSRSLRVLLSPATGGWSCSWCLSSWREGGWGRTFHWPYSQLVLLLLYERCVWRVYFVC